MQPGTCTARGLDDFTKLLVEKASKLKVGNPLDRDVFTGPVIDARRRDVPQAVADARRPAGKVLLGGDRITEGDLGRGTCQPTIVEAPRWPPRVGEELFVPFVPSRRSTRSTRR